MKPLNFAPQETNAESYNPMNEGSATQESPGDTLKARIASAMFGHLRETLNNIQHADVSEEYIATWQAIHDALPEGFFQNVWGLIQTPFETAGKVNEAVAKTKDFGFRIIRPFLTAEAPFVAAIPDNPHELLEIGQQRLMRLVWVKNIENVKTQVAFARQTAGNGLEFVRTLTGRIFPPPQATQPI